MEQGATVVVTGTTGCVGAAVASRLASEGITVIGLDRRTHSPACALTAIGDLGRPDTYGAGLPGRVDAVVHCAALVHARSPEPALVYRHNVEAATALLEQAFRRGARRFIQLSTIAVMDPAVRDASERVAMHATPYAWSKRQAEQRLRTAAAELDVECHILRLSTVYGNRDRGNIGRMARAIRAGWYVGFGSGDQRKLLVDVRRVAAHASTLVHAEPQTGTHMHVLHDGFAASMAAIEDAVAEALGRRPPRRLPDVAAKAVAAGGSVMATVAGRAPFDRRTYATYLSDIPSRIGLASTIPPPAAGQVAELVERFRLTYGVGGAAFAS
jgi:UDP-4-keto-D-QuiNAc 4-reductase